MGSQRIRAGIRAASDKYRTVENIEDNLVLIAEPNGAVSEAYRTLRANLAKTLGQGKRIFCVVSAWPGDGKSMVCANLAVALGQLHLETLLVDGDLRRPTLSRIFRLDEKEGLTDLLEDQRPVAPLLVPSSIKNLFLLPRGLSTTNPANLLGRHRMSEVFREACETVNCVIIDTPPMSVCSDAILMGVHADAAIMVVSPHSWDGDVELRYKNQLEENNIPVIGAVLNGAKASQHLSYSYGYGGYGYGYNYGYGGNGGYGYGGYGGYGQESQPKKKPRKWFWRRGQ